MVRPLFVMGAPGSGAAALTDYLNQLDEILICRERYKHIPEKIDPVLLTFERILDYEPMEEGGETNVPREYHVELLSKKDPAKIKWIGDQQPADSRRFEAIAENNPGAHFIVIYRPIEEVVGSFEDGDADGFEAGIVGWNRALQGVREHLKNDPEPNGLVLPYHDLFYRNDRCVPLLSRFLEMDFGDAILEAWAKPSREVEARRGEKEPITDEKVAYIEEHKDHETEAWILDRIERQWDEPELYKQTVGEESARRRLAAALVERLDRPRIENEKRKQVEKRRLQQKLARGQKRLRALEKRNRELSAQMDDIQASRSWKLFNSVSRLRSRLGSVVSRSTGR